MPRNISNIRDARKTRVISVWSLLMLTAGVGVKVSFADKGEVCPFACHGMP